MDENQDSQNLLPNKIWKYVWYFTLLSIVVLFSYRYLSGNIEKLSIVNILILVFLLLIVFSFRGKESSTMAKWWLSSFLIILIIVLLLGLIIKNESIGASITINSQVLSSILIVILFLSFPLIVYLLFEIFVGRIRKMKNLAHKYNLNYSRYPSTHKLLMVSEDKVKRNIISGSINSKNVYIYDLADTTKYLIGHRSITRRSSLISVGGKTTECRGKITGYCSIQDIEKSLKQL